MTNTVQEGPPSLFGELYERLKTLATRIIAVEHEMREVAETFRAQVPKCRLTLYAKEDRPCADRGVAPQNNPRYTGRPRGLYWGRVCKTRIVLHRKGFLNGGMIAKIALRPHMKATFYDFERDRLRLNRLRSWLVAAREGIRKVLSAYKDEAASVEISQFTKDLHPLVARDVPMVSGLWALARGIDSMPARMGDLAERSARETAAALESSPAVRFLVRMVDSERGNVRLHVTTGLARLPAERLTREMLHVAKIPPHVEEIYVRYRGEAKALNAQASRLRGSLAYIRRVIDRDPADFVVRRRPPRRREGRRNGYTP